MVSTISKLYQFHGLDIYYKFKIYSIKHGNSKMEFKVNSISPNLSEQY